MKGHNMATWAIDQSHSEVKFKVKHLVISSVTGYFKTFSGTVTAEQPDFSDAQVSFEADVDSVTTNDEKRDGHLKSADFFDHANHPKMTFVSTELTKNSENDYKMKGDLTIRGISKPVTLDVIFNGQVAGFGGAAVAGFEILGKVNRHDFGLNWSALTEAGGIVVGEEVKIDINIELNHAVEALKKAA